MGKFFKFAYGPVTLSAPMPPNIAAKYINPNQLQNILDKNPGMTNDYPKGWNTDGMIVKNTATSLPDTKYLSSKELDKVLVRHELKHWDNYKKGKYLSTGNASLKGVIHTIGDELSAYAAMSKGVISKKIPKENKLLATLIGTKRSVKEAYPKGILKALIGIK